MSRAVVLALWLILVSSGFAGEVLEDTIERSVPLNFDGSFSIQGIDGSVEIYGAETHSVQISATRKAFSPVQINAIRIEISGDAQAVNVKTIAPPTPHWAITDHSGTVNYLIKLPQRAHITFVKVPHGEIIIHGMRGDALNASLGHGRLISHNCFCDQKLDVVSGILGLFWDWTEMRAITVEGAIEHGNARAIVPGEASFRLQATSRDGHIASDFTRMSERRRGGVSAIDETIGANPLSRLTLRTIEGNIQVSDVSW